MTALVTAANMTAVLLSATPGVSEVLVEYTPFGGGRRLVRVMTVEEDIKNGRPGFDGVIVDGAERGTEVWGYVDQITGIRIDGATYRP